MIRTALPRALAASVLTLALTAHAAPVFLIDATTDGMSPEPGLGNVAFSLTYEDFNLDSLFSLTELLAFTGVFDNVGNYFDSLLGLPTVAGVTSGNGLDWRFGDSNAVLPDYTAPAGAFTPFATLLVPEPGSLALAAMALVALGSRRCLGRTRKPLPSMSV